MCGARADAVPGTAAGRRSEDDAEVRGATRADGGYRSGIVERRRGEQAPILADTGDFCGERGGHSSGRVYRVFDGPQPQGNAATAVGDCAAEQRTGPSRSTFATHRAGADLVGCERKNEHRSAREPARAVRRLAKEDGERGRPGCAVAETTTVGHAKAAEITGERREDRGDHRT